ncbi:MAG: hypothetical protein AB7P07_05765 [Hyphomonadaceae bacterium]
MSKAKPPLAVDLDGTLIRTDLFTRAMAALLARRPWRAPQLLLWLLRGRAHAKQKLTALFPIDAAALPYNEALLSYLRAERAAGRALALATAFDQAGADAVARHLALFDRVFASDGQINLKAHRKAAALAEAYPDGFAYAGNERADLAVWSGAQAAVVVNASAALERRAARLCPIERVFPRQSRNTT